MRCIGRRASSCGIESRWCAWPMSPGWSGWSVRCAIARPAVCQCLPAELTRSLVRSPASTPPPRYMRYCNRGTLGAPQSVSSSPY